MLRLLIPCLIWLSTVRSETGMQMNMPDGPLMDRTLDTSMLKAKRGSIHQPCDSIYSHIPAYSPPSVYVKPLVQPTYLKKELGIAQPLAHLQYIQQPPAYTSIKPAITYVKPVTPALNYHTVHQPIQYIKPVTPIQKPILSYAPIYQKPLYPYAPMYHDAMPKVFLKKYDAPVAQITYEKPLVHTPVPYAAPKIVQIQAPQLSYAKPVVHIPSPLYTPQPVHNSVIVKPDCV
ncbi:repetitive proline-rich cell wall protein-like [Nylanderia fulva]|uniref:repetitive proline-rich cell wall protein-like n=1 Tax=Nylanderia fulva TaxID=613905 RepID=UPI0010FAFD87|nr:repetitive proline-rich cell wall protein-like [Nylanderia fulva]